MSKKMSQKMSQKNVKLFLANPRGFCAGVVRAIKIVEEALLKFGKPVYVRHDIVHNHHVVSRLKNRGAIFVEEIEAIPHTSQPVIFSAHGVSQAVVDEAKKRNFHVIDATCPLVTKVHKEAKKWVQNNVFVLFIGHTSHPEAIGTTGRIPSHLVHIIENIQDALSFNPPHHTPLAYVTQTTLSVNDCADIISTLKSRFPHIQGPKTSDICYATTNRQKAVIAIAPKVDTMLIIGAPHSSNSLRLVELSLSYGCLHTFLVQDASDLKKSMFPSPIQAIGISASASAPEHLVSEIQQHLRLWFHFTPDTITTASENVAFPLPIELR